MSQGAFADRPITRAVGSGLDTFFKLRQFSEQRKENALRDKIAQQQLKLEEQRTAFDKARLGLDKRAADRADETQARLAKQAEAQLRSSRLSDTLKRQAIGETKVKDLQSHISNLTKLAADPNTSPDDRKRLEGLISQSQALFINANTPPSASNIADMMMQLNGKTPPRGKLNDPQIPDLATRISANAVKTMLDKNIQGMVGDQLNTAQDILKRFPGPIGLKLLQDNYPKVFSLLMRTTQRTTPVGLPGGGFTQGKIPFVQPNDFISPDVLQSRKAIDENIRQSQSALNASDATAQLRKLQITQAEDQQQSNDINSVIGLASSSNAQNKQFLIRVGAFLSPNQRKILDAIGGSIPPGMSEGDKIQLGQFIRQQQTLEKQIADSGTEQVVNQLTIKSKGQKLNAEDQSRLDQGRALLASRQNIKDQIFNISHPKVKQDSGTSGSGEEPKPIDPTIGSATASKFNATPKNQKVFGGTSRDYTTLFNDFNSSVTKNPKLNVNEFINSVESKGVKVPVKSARRLKLFVKKSNATALAFDRLRQRIINSKTIPQDDINDVLALLDKRKVKVLSKLRKDMTKTANPFVAVPTIKGLNQIVRETKHPQPSLPF